MSVSAPETTEQNTSTSPNLVALEHRILEFWAKHRTFEELVAASKSRKEFRFLDGPITANNPMGVHHAWGRSLKDIFIRYHCLRGEGSFFQNGFDCQGLWVEVEVEKELGFNGKPDIEAFGLAQFSAACKARIEKFSKIQTEQSIRLGQWMRWDDSYYTHRDSNIQGIWYFLKKCADNGWLYKSGLPMPWCTRCGTSLSEHEMAGSYKTLEHLAVFIKLKVPKLDSNILVWTTTPWTLPANTALAVNPELKYSQIKMDGEPLPLILCDEVLKGWKGKKFTVLKTFKGAELLGLEYEPTFPELAVQQGFKHQIVPWKDIDAKEGTGVVHMAPGCGREDFEVAKDTGIHTICPVDEKGDYPAGFGWLEGKNAHKVAEEIASALAQQGKLFKKYMHAHSYPVCWRCKHELLFRLVDEWYISSKEIRPQAIKAAAEVHWQPEHVGKRMEDWLKNMGDWCISRKRFWGLPLPFYPCNKCGTLTVVQSKQHLAELSGDSLADVPELHRPWIDQIKINCPKCKEKVSRVAEVGDCWLDAGIVPYTTRGYFDSEEGRKNWQPADWICEMTEQVRLWFYSMLFMGVTLSGRAPYKRVLTYERMLAETGAKFSKTGYMIRFDEAAEKMGVDTMRYYFASQNPANDIRFGYGRGDEARRQLIALWNIHSFFLTYASIDGPQIETGNGMPAAVKSNLTEMDRWLLARTHQFAAAALTAYEEFSASQVVREFETFAESVSNWYIRANRRRFWKSEDGGDKLAGYWTLFQALRTATIVMSPIVPFMTEEIWQQSIRRFDPKAPHSVHHAMWPELAAEWSNPELIVKSTRVQAVINLALRLRSEAQVKVRQPLSTLFVVAPSEQVAALSEMSELVQNELNVKALRILKDTSEVFDRYLELDLKKAGPVLKGDVGQVVPLVNALSGAELEAALAAQREGAEVKIKGAALPLPAAIFVVKSRARPKLVFAEEQQLFVALDTTITKELEQEGWIRDILRQCQVLRKDSGFAVQDRIELGLKTESAELNRAIEANRSLIENETLGQLSLTAIEQSKHALQVELSGGPLEISMRKK